MKSILIVLIIICLGFVSCDGRKSQSESLKESIVEFNKKQSSTDIVTYYPKDYTEVVTDTIISNQIKVHIKNFSLENETVFMSISETTSPKRINYHRVFESEIIVSSNSKSIFNQTISAQQLKSFFKDDFWNNATLQQVWVNEELSNTEAIQLDMSFINPQDGSYKLFRMTIDVNGQQEINLIEEHS